MRGRNLDIYVCDNAIAKFSHKMTIFNNIIHDYIVLARLIYCLRCNFKVLSFIVELGRYEKNQYNR